MTQSSITPKKYPEIDWTKNECHQLKLIVNQLEAILYREQQRHMMDCHLTFSTHCVIEEVIDALNAELDYDPTDDISGEPPMTASEMHTQAWSEHQALHS